MIIIEAAEVAADVQATLQQKRKETMDKARKSARPPPWAAAAALFGKKDILSLSLSIYIYIYIHI